jgi:hypothetical protein
MSLDLHAGKLLGFFVLIWPLLALALLVNGAAWTALEVAGFFVAPLVLTAAFWALGRRRWRLEITPDALIHHTLGRTERFDWRAIGSFEVRGLPLPDLVGAKSLRFAYPAAADGSGPARRLMLVFGDQSGAETAATLERFRSLYSRAPARPEPVDATIRLPMALTRLARQLLPLFFLLGAGMAALASCLPALDSRPAIFAAAVVILVALALMGRLHALTLDDHGLTLTRWGRRTEISWIAIEEATTAQGGVWPFRLPTLALTWRGDRPPFRKTRIGDLYGDRRLQDLLATIDERRVAAVDAINAD